MKFLKRIIVFFTLIILFSGILFNVANAGLFKRAVVGVVEITAVKAIVPKVIKFYENKAITSSKTKIIQYISNNPNKKEMILKYIKKQGEKLQMEKNASMLTDEINSVTPTLKQGINLPKNGIWSGNKGDSKFFITSTSLGSKKSLVELQKIMPKGVKFENGYPNFKPYAEKTINVEGMTGKHSTDVQLAKSTIIKNQININGKTYNYPKEINEMVKEKSLVYHHEGAAGKEMSLLDSSIHKNIGHSGSASTLRIQNGK